jgi:hypothetical protein
MLARSGRYASKACYLALIVNRRDLKRAIEGGLWQIKAHRRAEGHGRRGQPVAQVAGLAVPDRDRDRPVAVAARDHGNAGALRHITLNVSDLSRSRAFHEGALGLHVDVIYITLSQCHY